MKPRIVLIGAGSKQFGYGTLGDLFQSRALGNHHIVLHDINAAALAEVEQAGRDWINAYALPHELSATTDRAKALAGAAFCIISIEVGNRFELWEQDWHLPQQFGVTQVFGENGGAGGLFHSLRVIPPILEICADIERYCPNATVFNYSNPMSRICTTVHRRFPDLKFIGLCHEIASLERHLPQILEMPYSEMALTAGGLNHFSVLITARHRKTGENLYPAILDRARPYFDTLPGVAEAMAYHLKFGRPPAAPGDLQVDPARRIWPEREVFRILMDRFGCFPITTDSHFGEYLQWAHEGADAKGILDFHRYYRYRLATDVPRIRAKLTERVVPIIDGIVTGSEFLEGAVNLPNRGTLPELPDWLVVEVPARVGAFGVESLDPGPLPKGFAGLLTNQIGVHDLTAEAVLQASRDAAIQALLVDPVVQTCRRIPELVDAMIELQAPWLGYLH